jgi:hypothetical protein
MNHPSIHQVRHNMRVMFHEMVYYIERRKNKAVTFSKVSDFIMKWEHKLIEKYRNDYEGYENACKAYRATLMQNIQDDWFRNPTPAGTNYITLFYFTFADI